MRPALRFARLRPHRPAKADAADHADGSSPQAHVLTRLRAAQVRAMHEIMAPAQAAAMIASLAIGIILWHRVPIASLLCWIGLRQGISAYRILYSSVCLRDPARHADVPFVAMAVLDGTIWGALVWWITPIMNLEVSIVTLAMCAAIACIGVMMLHIHSTANWAFLVPNTIPTAFFALTRGDDLGVFCCLGYLGMTTILFIEGARLNQRSLENLRLRFESEQAHQAKSEALKQAQQLADMRSRFVATISHEMRTPLHGMLGLLRLVQEQADRPPNQRHLDLMRSSGQHLAHVINDVLDFAKLESAGLPISSAPMCLDAMLRDLADATRVNCQDKGLTLTLETQLPDQTWVQGDETRIRQILINLMGNAIKFTRQGGIRLSAQRDARTGHTILQVHDSGVGIAPEDLERIFEPFHQAEGTYERRFGGTGLGLTISRELCKAMGGTLTCESDAGRGSVFTFELPLPSAPRSAYAAHTPWRHSAAAPLDEPLAERVAAHAEDGQTTPHHVLVVDDNPVNTLVAEAELQMLGLRVSAVDSGAAALAWLAYHTADIILMDCEMPGMDGVAATQQIRQREQQDGRAAVPIIALTANGRDTFERRCAPAGMNDYLSKPFDRTELSAAIRRQLAAITAQAPPAAQAT